MESKAVSPAILDKRVEKDNPDQTYIAHVVNGQTLARVKSEDWSQYVKENNL